jgi:hypothetical protein
LQQFSASENFICHRFSLTALKYLHDIGTKGQRTVGKVTIGERGATVTVICAMIRERRKTLDGGLRLRLKTISTAAKKSMSENCKATHDSGDSSSEDEEWLCIICG